MSAGAEAARARAQLRAVLALSFGTGTIDAVGFLGLDRVFTANMTGNVVILGMAVAGAEDLPVLGPALALVGFMAGAAAGGRALRGAPAGWSRRPAVLFAAVGVVVAALGVALLGVDELSRGATVGLTTALGVVMGLQAATARFLAVKDVTTVVITSTITGLAADSRLGIGAGGGTGRRAAAVALMLLGALVGAVLLEVGLGVALLAPGAVVLVAVGATSVHHWRARRKDGADLVQHVS